MPAATGINWTLSSVVQVPICEPSAEQTDSPAVVHEAVGADEGCCAGPDEAAAAGATEGEMAGVLDCAATTGEGELGLSDGTAAGADDDEGCTTGDDALDCAAVELSLSPEEPPGTVQPMGVHSIPWTRPLPFGAMVLNKSGGTSMLPNAQPWQLSVTAAMVSVPVVGLWMEICLLQIGLSFGLAPLSSCMMLIERATMASPLLLVMPQEPDDIPSVSTACDERGLLFESLIECGK